MEKTFANAKPMVKVGVTCQNFKGEYFHKFWNLSATNESFLNKSSHYRVWYMNVCIHSTMVKIFQSLYNKNNKLPTLHVYA